ncbi:MAG TPA: acyl carrier protein [Terriglobales bacterium]
MKLIQQRLRTFITDNFLFGQDGAELLGDDSLIEKGVIDSTGVLQLISFLEREFNIKVEDEEVAPQNLDSIDCLTAFVQRKHAITGAAIARENQRCASPVAVIAGVEEQ